MALSKTCPTCGFTQTIGAGFCGQCGHEFRTIYDEEGRVLYRRQLPDTVEKPKRWFGSLGCLLCSIAILAILLLPYNGQVGGFLHEFCEAFRQGYDAGYGWSRQRRYTVRADELRVSDTRVRRDMGYAVVTGRVTNCSAYAVTYVRVQVFFYGPGDDTNAVETAWAFAVDATPLQPGDARGFEIMLRDDHIPRDGRYRVIVLE